MKQRILIVGRKQTTLEALKQRLQIVISHPVDTLLLGEKQLDVLNNQENSPSILVLIAGKNWQVEIKAVIDYPAEHRPALVVIGKSDNTELMREAMRAGAREYLPVPVKTNDVLLAVHRILREQQSHSIAKSGQCIAVCNVKGGSGGSFIAANIAHNLAVTDSQGKVALLDLDLQFGTQSLYFDLVPKQNFYEAIFNYHELDAEAIGAYAVKHKSELNLFCSIPEQVPINEPLDPVSLLEVIKPLRDSFDYIVFDLPRCIDAMTTTVFSEADKIILVSEQSLAHIRDAKRVVDVLNRELDIPIARINLLINRYERKNPVHVKDISKALKTPWLVPNDYRVVSESLNLGIPLADSHPRSKINKAIQAIVASFTNTQEEISSGLLGKLKRRFQSEKRK